MRTATEILRAAIQEWGNHSSLARESGVDVGIISRFARGESGVTLTTLDRLLGPLELQLRPVPQKRAKGRALGKKGKTE